MRVYLDCYPCFFDQILKTTKIITTDEKKIREILAEFGTFLPRISAEATPPEIGREVYRIIFEKTGVRDPYKQIKKICTQQALALYPKLKQRIVSSEDRLLTAIRVAIAGNIIDFGAKAEFDLDKDLEGLLSQELAIDHYLEFRKVLTDVQKVLYLADNAGETVFDRLLIEELGRPVTYVVRENPIINDAVYQDAVDAGVDKVAEIVSSGTDAPGTILDLCSEEFVKIFQAADLIISKGQGNYEGLSEEARPVFFLLKAKCSVIAHDVGVRQGSIVLKKAKNYQFSRKKGKSS
jgi:uncharacterized protein with ATP-grasp and redox domains